MTTKESIDFLRENLSEADLWGQLAEEAAELAQAALKMQRLCGGTNPPRKTELMCVRDVQEEHADIELCFKILDWHHDDTLVWNEKAARWAACIQLLRKDGQ